VQEVIKGDLPNAVKIPVVVPGGLRRFPDGSVVLLREAEGFVDRGGPVNDGFRVFIGGLPVMRLLLREVVSPLAGEAWTP
jgi:hypothetical protein